ncbi:MAG: DUF433 domain-containing protein [Candidatus Omnitrophica bacterium]|nr:DUF433 domain-containing protein [Candidatus Omnitrophota bacterium]
MKKKLITSSKDVLGGTPVFAKTRVPVRALFDYLGAGRSLDEFLDDFPSVKRSQAVGVLGQFKTVVLGPFYERAA